MKRSDPPAARALCEPLERRAMLALTGPHPITVSVFNDLNRDGARNSNEPGMPGWGVIAYEVRDETGSLQRRAGRTDAGGTLTLDDWIFDEFESPMARVYIEPGKRYYSTTHQRVTSGWFGVGTADGIEFGLTDVAPITGTLLNTYARQDGSMASTPLAGRRVYEDANNNRRFDANEKFGVTDLDGRYTIELRTGTHTLRAEPGAGWTSKAGTKLVRMAVVYPYQEFPTFNARMTAPTTIDVLAAYTPAAGEVLRTKPLDDLFREANRVYANSNTNVQINLKGFKRTLYNESGDIESDLMRLQNGRDGLLDDVITERERIDADLTVLLTSRARTGGEVVGLAYQYASGAGGDRFGFSVVTIDHFERGATLAHELGHNLGAGHDAVTAGEDDDHASLAPYAFGYRFRAGPQMRTYKDVMAYGPGTPLPFFSTPNFKWLGKPIGTADSADNARIVREIAPLVARYR